MASPCEAAASSSSTSWRGIMDLCAKICHEFTALVYCDSLLILHRSKWQCLARTYSTVIASLTKQVEEASLTFNQETICQKLLVSLDSLHHAMQEGERCFKDCICESSEINHTWLVEKALKFCMSTDIVDIHLHDFIWAYATVKEQALWLGIHFDRMELPDLEEETIILCTIWAAEDTKSDLCTAQEQLLTNFMGKDEEETLHLAKFIVNKITHIIKDKVDVEAHNLLPDFLLVDPTSVKRNQDYIIANGSYGVVYEATWLRGCFAVKEILYPGEEAHSGREQAIQARLCHSHVINLVCCTRNPFSKRLCFVMELMQQDLQGLVKGRKQHGMDPPFTPLEAIDLMLQVAKGMEYLHSLNIIHRDLKSSNVLVSFPPISNQKICHHTHLKIADFGTAKAKETSSSFTTKPIGTRAWRAPEVGSDAHPKYHKTADVYSFGMVCYEILTGELPFKETQHLEMRVMRGERPKLPNYCPSALASYIERCWDGNPAARPSFTSICRMLRYLKACILLENSHDPPCALLNWLAHPISSRACARITGMLDSSISALPRPLSILLEMYWCRIVLQESHAVPESNRLEGVISDCPTTPSSPVEHHVEQVNGFSLESCRQEGVSDYTTTPSSSVEHYVEQVNGFRLGRLGRSTTRLFNKFSRNFKVYMRPPTAQDEMPTVKKMTLKELRVATIDFNSRNKIDEDGFGSFYKGTLKSGRVVAVKVLAGECFAEFQKELKLMNILRHRNLIQLLGYCVEDSKRLLVYEFLCFRRLDNLLFDHNHASRREELHWGVRVYIIKGVAKGLCYLHEDAPFKIVHRDIKPMNIFLDETMNPKISGFGIARELDDDDIVVAGTMGYIAPDYVRTGELTAKVDVYSFGILVLETISGQRILNGTECFLLERAWSLFENEEEMWLLDPGIANTEANEVRRVVQVALLCTQATADERPSMFQVYTMLSNEAENMPLPSKPTYLFRWEASNVSSMQGSPSVFASEDSASSVITL